MTDPTPQTPTRDEAVRAALSDALFWLEGALQCDKFEWSTDQGSLATDALERGRAALASVPTPASGGVDAVAVKALEWLPDVLCHGQFLADAGGGYQLEPRDGSYAVIGGKIYELFDTLDEAKPAAQADYEQRIRSVLSPAATPVSEAGGAALALDSEMRNAEFETWARKNGCHLHLHEGGEDRRYGYDLTERAWLGWCAALAKPASSPAGEDAREALKPFADIADSFDQADPTLGWVICSVYLSDLRRARSIVRDAALSQSTSAGRVGE